MFRRKPIRAAFPLRVFKGLQSINRNDVFFNFNINTTDGNDLIGSGKRDGHGIPPDFFSDVHVRKAFNYCFDWAAFIKQAQLGEGVQSFDVILPGEIGTTNQDPHYSYDPDKCKSEFRASTLKSTGGASLWEIGFWVSIAYNANNPLRQAVAQILAQNVKAVNPKFQVDAVGLPWPTFLDASRASKLPIAVQGWLEDIHDPHNWLVPYVLGVFAVGQSLPAGLAKPLADLINQGVVETDPVKRAAIYKQFNQAFYAAALDILLAVAKNRHYEQRWVQGYYSNPIYDNFYYYALSKQ